MRGRATLKARYLEPGDRVAVVSPSWCGAGLYPHRLERGVATLRQLELEPVVTENAVLVDRYLAGPAAARALDIDAAFRDPEIAAVFCAIGGDHSNQLLPLLSFQSIARNPKVFIGFSDNTVLQLALWTKCRLCTFYGPTVLTGLAEYPEIYPFTRDHLLAALFTASPVGDLRPSRYWTDEYLEWGTREDLSRPRTLRPGDGWSWLREGSARGTLLGGCLPSMMHLRGTEYWPSFEGCIFFWELPEGPVDPNEVDSLLMDLELSGVFDQITGMVVGRPYQYTAEKERDLDELLLERLDRWSFPILTNVEIGHTDPVVTIPIGTRGLLCSRSDRFSLTEAGCTA